jgi:hypothetical protein
VRLPVTASLALASRILIAIENHIERIIFINELQKNKRQHN